MELPDHALDTEGFLITKQMKERVRQTIAELPKKDRELLPGVFSGGKRIRMMFAEQFGVDRRDYFRVLLHRAKDKFRVLYEKDRDALLGGGGVSRGAA